MVNNNEHKYVSCLCSNMNVKTATILIAVFVLLGGIYSIATMSKSPYYPEYTTYFRVIKVSWSFTAFLAIIAVGMRASYVLLPFLVMLMFGFTAITVAFVCLLLMFILGVFYPQHMSEENVNLWVKGMFVVGFTLPITFWFLKIVKRCYCHLQERRNTPEGDPMAYVAY